VMMVRDMRTAVVYTHEPYNSMMCDYADSKSRTASAAREQQLGAVDPDLEIVQRRDQGVSEGCEVPCRRGAGHGDGAGTGRRTGAQPSDRVLDHDARRRIRAEPLGPQQVGLRIGLAAGYL